MSAFFNPRAFLSQLNPFYVHNGTPVGKQVGMLARWYRKLAQQFYRRS